MLFRYGTARSLLKQQVSNLYQNNVLPAASQKTQYHSADFSHYDRRYAETDTPNLHDTFPNQSALGFLPQNARRSKLILLARQGKSSIQLNECSVACFGFSY